MKPLLRQYIPIEGIENIHVFVARIDSSGNRIFPVSINGIEYFFFLNNDAIWETNMPSDLTRGVIDLVGLLIEKIHGANLRMHQVSYSS